ncbi:MAG: SpoIIE family protein phosphatase [Acidobacteria bacterium]|nr:SpoIIE family protein phosphatase [Acidobacteriota bacterium]
MPNPWSKLGRWNQVLLALIGAYLALWPFEPLSATVYTLRVILQVLLYVVGCVILARLGYRVVRLLGRRFLWRVRHRMMVAYFFVGVAPLALAFVMAAVGAVLLFLPVGAYLVRAQVEERAAALYAAADSLAWQLRASDADRRRAIGEAFLREAPQRYPGLEARLETGDGPVVYPQGALQGPLPPALESYRGIVRRDGRYYMAAYALYQPGEPSLLLMFPLTTEYLAELLPALGRVSLGAAPASASARFQFRAPAEQTTRSGLAAPPAEAHLPPPVHPLDWRVNNWPAPARVLDWGTGTTRLENIFVLQTRPSAVLRVILDQQSPELRSFAGNLSWILMILFAVAVVISTVVAVSITRTATSAIHDLYVGTRHVDQGDFSYRVPQRGYSQLTELARSFNHMTASIERLIADSKERQRLESELAIAQEVQAQLFPREAPRLPSFEVLGVCRPARAVSGDFYDYVRLSEHRVALSFGDVAGKGISAALVMAAMHSTLRTQLALMGGKLDDADLSRAAARLATETNRQLCAGTAPDKFATLFFGAFDERSGSLAYVNAGHLPPVRIRDGQAQRLEVTGMVVGAFSHACYEAASIDLQPGDLLVAFTDGLTEPENPYEEQFGEERLVEALTRVAELPLGRIAESIIAEVDAWTGKAPEQQDDMTILIARRLG